MKTLFYLLVAVGSTLAVLPSQAGTASRPALADRPAEARRSAARAGTTAATTASAMHRSTARKTGKVAAKLHRNMLVVLGLEAHNNAMAPAQRDWQLHQHQQHLKSKAIKASRAHRRRVEQQLH